MIKSQRSMTLSRKRQILPEQRARAALLFSILLAALAGCGGSQTEPQEPEQESASSLDSASSDETDDSLDLDASGADDGGTSDASMDAPPATPQDFEAALQLVMGDEALLNALNLEEPGRFPIKIAGADIPRSIEVQAATKAVEVVSPPEDPKTEPVLVFTKIELSGTEGTFKYRYDIEGVRGTTTVVKTGERWELKSSRISGY